MRIGSRIGWLALWVLFPAGVAASLDGEPARAPVLSSLAVVDTVKAGAPADRAGMKAGDQVVELDGNKASRLEDVLAYRFDWEKGRETVLGLRRGGESLQIRLPQGDWGCEFRADLAEEPLARLSAARSALRKPESRPEGRKNWEELADEVLQAGFPDVAGWLGIELGKALIAARLGPEAQAVLQKWGQNAPEQSFWSFAASLELARASTAAADPDGASQAYERAGNLVKNTGNELRLAGLLVKVFNFELNRGRLAEAKQAGTQVLAIRERLVPDSLQAGEGFQNLGMVSYAQGDLGAAKELFLKSLAIKERLAPDTMITATNLNNLGAVAAAQGDLAGARTVFRKALAIQQRLSPNSLLVASSLGNLAILDATEGNLASARELFQQSLAIRERLAPDSLDAAHVQTNLAGLLVDQGELSAAREYYAKALAIRERLAPDSLDVAHTLSAMSNVYRQQGDLKSARECATRGLAIQERLAPKSLTVAAALIDLGHIVELQGDLATASQLLARALSIQEGVAPDNLKIAVSLDTLGNIVREQGDLAMAREYYLKALAVRERLAPNSLETAFVLTNLGSLAFDRGEPAAARDYHLQALAMMERLAPDNIEVAGTLAELGKVLAAQGDPAGAGEMYRRALTLAERLSPESLYVADTLNGLGNLRRTQGDPSAAGEHLRRAIAIYERLAPGSRGLADNLRGLALAEKAAGQRSESAALLARAIDTLEVQRSRAGGESARSSFASVTGDFYTDLIAAYLDSKDLSLALETLERSRARTMLEMVSTRYIDLEGEIPAALLERQRDLAGLRRRLSDQLAQAGPKADPREVEAWRTELLMLPQKEDALAEEIRRASPRLAALQYPKPLNYQAMRDTLEPGTVLVAYAVGEKESYLFTLRRLPPGAKSPELQAVRLEAGRKELENRVMAYRSMMDQPDPGAEEWKASSRELFSLLLGPVAPEIAGSERILLLPDGPLHLLPFATLMPKSPVGRGKVRLNASQPLGLQRPISVQASLTVYTGLKSGQATGPRSPGLTWTGFGDPVYPGAEQSGEIPGELAHLRTRGFNLGPLPGTRQEIEGIARLFGAKAQVRLGREATKESVLKLSRGTNLVHFACHGLLDPDFPMNSALALSPAPEPAAKADGTQDGGLLQAWEVIQDLRLDSDCVVLSACETGVGRICGGEGILGLTRAFLYAGARSVVVSLWPISDESTARFMQAFYRETLAGAPRDQALKRAQEALARQPDFAHPFHWAAFVLVGSGD